MTEALHDGDLICLLCFPRVTVFGEVVPGYVLLRAEEDHHRCKQFTRGKYALSWSHHDADIVLPVAPASSPFLHLSVDDWDRISLDEHHQWFEEDARHDEVVEQCRDAFLMEPGEGYALTLACHEAGCRKNDLVGWLIDRMARLVGRGPLSGPPTESRPKAGGKGLDMSCS